MSDRKRMLKELKKTIKERTEENASLSKELEELNVSVNERKHIHEVNGQCQPAAYGIPHGGGAGDCSRCHHESHS